MAVFPLLIITLSALPASGFIRYAVVDPLDGKVYPTSWEGLDFPIKYMINAEGSNDIADGSEFLAIRSAFDAWQNVDTASVSFQFDGFTTKRQTGYDGVNLLVFARDDPDFQGTITVATTDIFVLFPAIGQVEARIVDADIRLNDDFVFSTADATPPLQRDVQAVVTHEIGHLLGLDHSPIAGTQGGERQATMFPHNSAGQNQERSLEPDDIAGASTIYPSKSFSSNSGSISGRVVDRDGAPVSGAHLLAYAPHEPGRPLVGSVTGFGGNPPGEYKIQGLPPGPYLVRLEPLVGSFGMRDLMGQSPATGLASGFGPEYFDDSRAATGALEINVEAGLDIGGVDFVLGSPSPPAPPKIDFIPDGGSYASIADLTVRITSPAGLDRLNLDSFGLTLNGEPIISGEEVTSGRRNIGVTLRRVGGSILEIHLPHFSMPEGINQLAAQVAFYNGAIGRKNAQFISSPSPPLSPMPFSGRVHLNGDAEIGFNLDGGYQVSGTIRDASGDPLSGGSLRFAGGGGVVSSAPLGRDGRYNIALRPGRYDAEVYLPGARRAAARTRLDLYKDMQLDIALDFSVPAPPPADPHPLLHGVVTDQLGRVLPLAQVEVYAEGSALPVATGATNDLGIYQIVLEPGLYRVRASPRGSPYTLSNPIAQEVENLSIASNLRHDFPLPNGFILSGSVQDGQGTPMAFANIRVFSVQGASITLIGVDAEGRFRAPLPTGEYSLVIDPPFPPPHGSRAISATFANILLERDTDIDMALPDGLLVSGTVLKPTGEPARFAALRAIPQERGGGDRFFVSDESGLYSTALPPGRYTMVAEPRVDSQPGDKTVRTVVRGVDLGRDRTFNITLNEGVEIRGLVRAPSGEGLAGAIITVAGYPQDLPYSDGTTTGEGGNYRLVLPPGGFLVQIRPPDHPD